MQERGPAAYIAEFIGTFALVFFVTAAVSLYVVVPAPAFSWPDFAVLGLVHVFVLFALIQTLAVAGALVTKALLLDEGEAVNYGATTVSEPRLGGDILPGMVAEAIGTFFLVFVIVGVAVNPRAAKDWAALAIGATLGVGVMVLAPLSGAGFNPARSFGPALVADAFGGAKDFILVYTVAPLVGALLAALVYYNLYIAPGAKEPGGMEPVG